MSAPQDEARERLKKIADTFGMTSNELIGAIEPHYAVELTSLTQQIEELKRQLKESPVRANRFDLRCPRCGEEKTNSREAGGNEKCFHCGKCGFVECEWCSPAHEKEHPESAAERQVSELKEALRKAENQKSERKVTENENANDSN